MTYVAVEFLDIREWACIACLRGGSVEIFHLISRKLKAELNDQMRHGHPHFCFQLEILYMITHPFSSKNLPIS